MKITKFTQHDFQNLNQLDKIEFLVRKKEVKENIKRSLPIFEIISIFAILMYSRLHTLLLLLVFDFTEASIQIANAYSLLFNTMIVILFISFIGRIIVYFQKHKQLNDLHEEFLDRIYISNSVKSISAQKK